MRAIEPMNAALFEERIEAIVRSAAGAEEAVRLGQLFDLTWEWFMTQYPEWATRTGYPGQNDRWTDWSPEAIRMRREALRLPLEALGSIRREELGEPDRLDHDLFRRELEERIEGSRFPREHLGLDQLRGVQITVPQLLALMPTFTLGQYEDILSRLRGVPRLVDQTISLLESGVERGVTQPRVPLLGVLGQIRTLLMEDPNRSPLLQPFERFPDTIPAQAQERVQADAAGVLAGQVYPAFRRLLAYLEETYLPRARETTALTALPDGEAWYAYEVRRSTTTDLTPEEIHAIGLREVKRIRGEMEKAIAEAGFRGSLLEFSKYLAADPRFFFARPEELLAGYRDIAKRADPELVKLFGRLPRLPYGVKPVPSYAEKSQPAAYYQAGSLEAGRPAYFFANTYDLRSRPRWEMEALTLHEAVPGHHLQISLARELEGLPRFRQHGSYTAFVEGWGLYAEGLGEEMGFYGDPHSRFGRLTFELWRAIRLVVDTGLHALGWSRQRANDYFETTSGRPGHEVVVEVDRYIVWPGQALAYKIGELKLQELRARARAELGEDFDLRAFHDEVLGGGALPLDFLEARVNGWVGARKRAQEERP
jgi:uncharacterized protein (DUF885 family)